MIGMILAASIAAGTYHYQTTYNGADLGLSTVTVQSGGTTISEKTQGSYMGTNGNATATLSLNADLTPKSYAATGSMGNQPMNDAATVNGNTATITSAQGASKTVQLPAAAQHFVIVDLGSVAGFIALPEQIKTWNASNVCAVIPSLGQSLELPTLAPPTTGGPAGDAALAFGGNAPFTIWYNAQTLVPDRIEVPSQNLTIARLP